MNDNINEDDFDEEAPYEFPFSILDSISENSPEAFILFTVNRQGEVEIWSRSNSPIMEEGVRSRALKILGALDSIDAEDVADQIAYQKEEQISEIIRRIQEKRNQENPDKEGEEGPAYDDGFNEENGEELD